MLSDSIELNQTSSRPDSELTSGEFPSCMPSGFELIHMENLDIQLTELTPVESSNIQSTGSGSTPIEDSELESSVTTLDVQVGHTLDNIMDLSKLSNPKSSTSLATPRTLSSASKKKEWVPFCLDEFKPKIGMCFPSLEEGIKFYQDYSKFCGFTTRLATRKLGIGGEERIRYVVCNKEGERKSMNPSALRKRLVTRMKCAAMVGFMLNNKGQYSVYKFVEAHSHCLSTPVSRQFLRGASEFHVGHKRFIFGNLKVNKGPTVSFRMWKEQVGGYLNIGASLDDFKNFYRDLKSYIKDGDAQMFIETLFRKKETSPGFFFDFEVDESGCLTMVFWADAIARKNFALFGDSISFDTTYSTNKYSMIFTPFTGVDHHNKCVTFGAGLLGKEDVSSFTWLFETFLKAMGGSQPRSIITDQDPAMKIAIEKVFTDSAHRFCVWHIMKKLPDKVSVGLRADVEFFKRINRAVYNRESEPSEFESEWKTLTEEYNLQGNTWLTFMYGMKEMWVPAYFRDLYLGGLLRTTSRSESENNFFGFFTNEHITLLELHMRFESAMDAQRYKLSKLESSCKNALPPLRTQLPLEKDASLTYTHSRFYDFQKEAVSACFEWGLDELHKENGSDIFTVINFSTRKTFVVVYKAADQEVTCSCKMYLRVGILCRHCIWVLHARGVHKLPTSYILPRWTKEATKKPIFDIDGNLLEACEQLDEKNKILGHLWSEMYRCVGLAEDSVEDLSNLLNTLRLSVQELVNKHKNKGKQTKADEMEKYMGCKAPTTITIQNPNKSSTKGSRKNNDKDNEPESSPFKVKKQRKCKTCGKIVGHNTRTCPERKT